MIDTAPTFRREIHVTIGQLNAPNGYLVVPPNHPWASPGGAPETLNGHEVTYYGLSSEFFFGKYPSGSMVLGIDTQSRMAGSDPLALMEEVSRALIVARGQAVALLPPKAVDWSSAASRARSVSYVGPADTEQFEQLAGALVESLPAGSRVSLVARPLSGTLAAHVSLPDGRIVTISSSYAEDFKTTLKAAAAIGAVSTASTGAL